jgi:hypothetical protein
VRTEGAPWGFLSPSTVLAEGEPAQVPGAEATEQPRTYANRLP